MTSAPRRLDQVPNGCWVACIAMLTGLPHDELVTLIPRDLAAAEKSSDYHNAVNAYMRARGWRLAYVGRDIPQGFSIMSGKSPRGENIYHAVVALDGVLWHDPHDDRAGLATVEGFEIMLPILGTVPQVSGG